MIGRRAPLLACRRSFAARGSFGRGHRCSFHILTMSIFTLQSLLLPVDASLHCQHLIAQYKREVVLASIGQTSPPQRDSAIPVTPNPPNRVRVRPVLHLEEPAATLPAPVASLSAGQTESPDHDVGPVGRSQQAIF